MELWPKRVVRGRVTGQAVTLPPHQSTITIRVYPDLAALEGLGPVGIGYMVWQQDPSADPFAIRGLRAVIKVEGGVLWRQTTSGWVVNANKRGESEPFLLGRWQEEIKHDRHYDHRCAKVHTYEGAYHQYAVPRAMWLELDGFAVDAEGQRIGDAAVPCSVDIETDARTFGRWKVKT